MPEKVIIADNGGRGDAMGWKLKNDDPSIEIHFAGYNASGLGVCHNIGDTDIAGQVALAKRIQPDLYMVGPEIILGLGIVDRLAEEGIRACGPTALASQIEMSKLFGKSVLKSAGIPTAWFRSFSDYDKAVAFVETLNGPIVIKADGAAGGKGVSVCQTQEEALEALHDFMVKKIHGEAAATVLVEECLVGPEYSILAIVDKNGKYVILPAIEDYKRLLVGDKGPNTGSMGCNTGVKACDPSKLEEIGERFVGATIRELERRGIKYSGVIYISLMLTENGEKVIEYNCRFGDPEGQVALVMLDEPLLPLLIDAADGTIKETRRALWKPGECACLVAASQGYGYPGKIETGKPIHGVARAQKDGAIIFYAGVKRQGDQLFTAGGRVLNVVAARPTLQEALNVAYSAMDEIRFGNGEDEKVFRTDIGHRSLRN